MLAIGLFAQIVTTYVVSVPAFLLPYLHNTLGMSLGTAGWLAAAPSLGLVAALVAWGALADRFGERLVIVSGLALTAATTALALLNPSPVLLGLSLGLAGAAGAAVNASTGRIVIGWFPKHRRGLAMGIRQMSQPLGTALAAVTVPQLALGQGIPAVIVTAVVLNLVAAFVALAWLRNPPAPATSPVVPPDVPANPYREAFLWRIHAVSALLVYPQYAMSIFALVWLVGPVGMSTVSAGIAVGLAQLTGAFGRVAVGWWSDRMGSRMRPLRIVAAAAVLVMGCLALASLWPQPLVAVVLVVLATTISVADNGLAFAAVAEAAGPRYSGRALGTQNTGQFLAAATVGPALGALITAFGFPVAFALTALAPVLAVPLLPRIERDRT